MGRAEYHKGDHKPTQLQVLVDAMELHAHTCHIMSNPKFFDPSRDFNGMTMVHIFETTMEVYLRLYEANSIRVDNNPALARERLELGTFAAVAIDKMLALQDLAKAIWRKLGGKPRKFWYWANMAVSLKDGIKAWRDSERKRYGAIANAKPQEDFALPQGVGGNGSRLKLAFSG